jgi:quercetin dioxygenase-like cupin family protein
LISDTFWILFDPLLKRLLFSYREVLRQIRAQAMSSATGPPHSQDDYEETAYGLSGVLTVTVEGKTFLVSPGQAACVPRGAVHSFCNNTAQDAKVLCIITPAAVGPEYFREIGAVLKPRLEARPTAQRWLKSCTAMG